jgi:hypothetical protein
MLMFSQYMALFSVYDSLLTKICHLQMNNMASLSDMIMTQSFAIVNGMLTL